MVSNALMRGLALSISALFVPPILAGPSTFQQDSEESAPQAFAAVEAFVRGEIELGRYQAVAGLVFQRGKNVLELTMGEAAPGMAMELDTIVRIYSMTKAVTAAAAMTLVEEEALDLDAPVASYLPSFKGLKVLVEGRSKNGEPEIRLEPCERPMLVRHLLTHTSGLTYGFFGNSEADRRMRGAAPFAPGVTNKSMVERIAGVPLKYQPGTRFEYGLSSDVLGRVLEVVSKKPLDELLQERIFGPLGMVDTGFDVPQAKLRRVATCYVRRGRTLRPARLGEALDPRRKATHHSGGGGLYSTALDYMRFCRMLLGEGALGDTRVLSKESAAEMMRDHLDGRPAPMLGWTGGAFGFGLAVQGADPRRGMPKGTVWWGGIAGTGFWIDQESGCAGVFMIQTMNEAIHAAGFRRQVYGAIDR